MARLEDVELVERLFLKGYPFSFMGSIVGPRKLINDSAPEVARRLSADAVDVVLLTPA